jgi:hypothetical protein
MTDITKKPDVEFDNSLLDILKLRWIAPDGDTSFAISLQDGLIVGVLSSVSQNRSASWKIDLPAGVMKVNCMAFADEVPAPGYTQYMSIRP